MLAASVLKTLYPDANSRVQISRRGLERSGRWQPGGRAPLKQSAEQARCPLDRQPKCQ